VGFSERGNLPVDFEPRKVPNKNLGTARRPVVLVALVLPDKCLSQDHKFSFAEFRMYGAPGRTSYVMADGLAAIGN
jgi:hypothetical protein